MSVSRLHRRATSTLVASLLAVGTLPLLASPTWAAPIGTVTPTFSTNSSQNVDVTIQGNGDTPFTPADVMYMRRTGTTGNDVACPLKTTSPGVPASDIDTLIGVCDFRAAAPTIYDVVVDRAAPGAPTADDIKTAAFTIFGGQPTITTVAPAARGRGAPNVTNATIAGTNLSKGAVVEFLSGGSVDPGVTFTVTATATDMKLLTGTLVVSGSATLGAHDVRVTTTDGGSAVKAGGFTVNPAPVVTALSPPSVGQNANLKVVTITGTGFQPNVQVKFLSGVNPDNGVTLGAKTFVNTMTLTVPVTVSSSATGSRTIVVENPDDGGSVQTALAITAAPVISSLTPASRGQNSAPQDIAVVGSGFVTTGGQQTQFFLETPKNVVINSVTVNSPTSATLNVTVPANADPGSRKILTTNFDGGNSATVDGPPSTHLFVTSGPSPLSVSPGSRVRGFTGEVTINGGGFATASAPSVSFGPGITVNSTSLASPASSSAFKANITVSPSAEQGLRQVTVTNPDGGVGTCSCFTVDAIAVTGSAPTGVVNGSSRTITISGVGFSTGGTSPTVKMVPPGNPSYQPDIAATSVTVAPTGSSLTATFDLTFAAPFVYSIRVTNPNGDSGACSSCFTVLNDTLTVASISPASRVQGAQNQLVTVTGTGFSNGLVLSFPGKPTITVDTLTLVLPTQLTAVIDIALGTLTGASGVTVTLPNGATNTCANSNCFTVNAAPTLTSANPNTIGQGGSRLITFTGTGFVAGASLAFGKPGVSTVGNPTVVSATSMTATIAVASDTEAGPVSVTVVNTDGGQATCATACLTVTLKPVVTSVSPDKGGVGTSFTASITGSGFADGTPVVTAGEGITVTNPTRVSATLVTATFSIAPAATKGSRTIGVTLADGGTATCPACFAVVSAPTFGSIAPDRGTQSTTRTVTVTGTDFTVDPKPTLSFGDDITVDSVGAVTATTITATITIGQTAATGARAVTVTNPDGGSVACAPTCFTVVAAPTVASAAPSSVARGRNGVAVTVTGEGFAADSTVSFGDGVTVVGTPTVTVNETGADQIAATVDVSPTTTAGNRAVTVTNPSDFDASGVCPACFSITAGRIMVVQIFDTKGTASTADDVLTDKPVSGTAYRVVVTAKNGETASDPNDTAFTGTVALSTAPVDDTFTAGTCAAAVAGISNCTGVVFGDLGSRTLAAQASGNDSDRRGTVAVVTQAAGLVFTAAPTTATMGDELTFTVRPTSPVNGADLDGYAADRTLTLTGTGANRSSGPLDCDDADCSVTLSWSQQGTKTVKVTDDGTPSRSTPTITVNIVSVGLFKALSPSRILDTRKSNDNDGFSSPIGSNSTINVQATGQGGVPSTDVSAVVVNVTVDRPTAGGYLALFPSGGVRPTSSTLNFNRGDIVANLAVVKVGTGGKIAIYNFNGNTSTILDVVGYYTASTTGAGGRLVAVDPERIFDTTFGSRLAPGETRTVSVTDRGGVPATNVDSVILSVSAIAPTGNAFLTVYPADLTTRPLASTLNFRAGNNVANLVYAKVSPDGKVKVYNPAGSTHVSFDVMGYVLKTGTATLGRFVSLTPSRVIDTRGRSNSPIVGKLGPGGAIEPTLVGVGGIPATGVSAVVVNLTATEGTARSSLTAYPKGITAPNTSNVHFNAGQNFANLVVVKLGDDGKVRIVNKSGQVHVIVDVVGYLTT